MSHRGGGTCNAAIGRRTNGRGVSSLKNILSRFVSSHPECDYDVSTHIAHSGADGRSERKEKMTTNYSVNSDSTFTISVTGTADELRIMVAAMLIGLVLIKLVTK
jgi:hypothetical protein